MTENQKKIIVIDDDEDTREFVQDVLVAGGYLAVMWPGAAGALPLILREQPDLVILDLQMEGDTDAGMRVFEEIQGDPQSARIPILLYSGDTEALPRHAPRVQAACGDVLPKPFEVGTLYALIERLTTSAASPRSRSTRRRWRMIY